MYRPKRNPEPLPNFPERVPFNAKFFDLLYPSGVPQSDGQTSAILTGALTTAR